MGYQDRITIDPGKRGGKILAEILASVPDDEQGKIAGANTARLYAFDVARPASR